jgi:hypothetical protein
MGGRQRPRREGETEGNGEHVSGLRDDKDLDKGAWRMGAEADRESEASVEAASDEPDVERVDDSLVSRAIDGTDGLSLGDALEPYQSSKSP